MKKFSGKTVVAACIGAVLFFLLGRFVSIPSPVADTTINIQYGFLAFFAAVYGPVAGLLAGLAGHILIDITGVGLRWGWIIATGVFGTVMGFITRKLTLEDGEFSKHDAVGFNIGQAVAHLVSWVVIAPVLDMLMYSEPAKKVFLQGFAAAAVNIIMTAVVGTLLLFVYAAAKPKKGRTKREK